MATAGATRQRAAGNTTTRLERTAQPGVTGAVRAKSQYLLDGRQRKEAAASFRQAREIKLAREAEARNGNRGPTLHVYALEWVRRHRGSGRDTVCERTRAEYRRLLVTLALRYFGPEVRLRDLDREALQGFVDWLTARRGRRGRMCDGSIHNAVVPLRLCLEAAASVGLVDTDPCAGLLLPRRRNGSALRYKQGRCLTRAELARLLAELPHEWQPFFRLLAATGVRISEAIALRWRNVDLEADPPRLSVRRAISTESSGHRSHAMERAREEKGTASRRAAGTSPESRRARRFHHTCRFVRPGGGARSLSQAPPPAGGGRRLQVQRHQHGPHQQGADPDHPRQREADLL